MCLRNFQCRFASLPVHLGRRGHAKYWFADGSVIVTIYQTLSNRDPERETVLFKLHSSLLPRHSTYFGCVLKGPGTDEGESVTVPPGLGVRVEEFVSLLEHLYHDTPLSSNYLEAMFPSGPFPFTHPNHLEEALALTTTYDVRSPRHDNSQGDIVEDSKTRHSVLSPADVERRGRLMAGIVDHFTPILFTPPATPHMACTGVFADQWMSLVIPSAISDGGVYKPLETLESIKQLDWAAEGLCPDWTEEQAVVWEKVGSWLG
ncbi:hypothetical protein F5J12DRAFT_906949 [Pisolithus orientalis]|uniref:uncharacterized protein n=1 Tax=Pisolithus orientalis TaxID=936130 RepID=UPI002225A73C|nr:uncharacterized protein F5J12DRAFT_906949 [Pisolithus orientalis]KAI5997678.1 hypothetical protein F5J12DRAFT_906949 [Pisolithus orientalis]